MCPNESIHLPKEYTSIDSKNYENFKDPFEIKIKVILSKYIKKL